MSSLIFQSGLNQVSRDQIEKKTKRFLRSGGRVERIEKGRSGCSVVDNKTLHVRKTGGFITKMEVKNIVSLNKKLTDKEMTAKFHITLRTLRDIVGDRTKEKEV